MKRTERNVLQAATFKAEALAVMRRVQETGQAVTITSRGKPLVRIEPIRADAMPVGYGAMRDTVEFLVPAAELVEAGGGAWNTLESWDEISKP